MGGYHAEAQGEGDSEETEEKQGTDGTEAGRLEETRKQQGEKEDEQSDEKVLTEPGADGSTENRQTRGKLEPGKQQRREAHRKARDGEQNGDRETRPREEALAQGGRRRSNRRGRGNRVHRNERNVRAPAGMRLHAGTPHGGIPLVGQGRIRADAGMPQGAARKARLKTRRTLACVKDNARGRRHKGNKANRQRNQYGEDQSRLRQRCTP